LPFTSLMHDTPGGTPQYLIQWKPVHQVASMSLYAEIRQSRHAFEAMGPLVAFGDPKYPAQSGGTPDDIDVQALVRRGMTLASLPGTRIEVNNIARLFAPHATTYLGDTATESRATALDRSVRFVHFAVHGVIDDEQPLNSALVLTMPAAPGPDGRNGLLQAWKIFEHLRLDADLVTLSACDTALGKQISGEGVVGLTRAFLYAGAHTVASSLWRVADGPTVDLMTQFYANLKAGLPKDRALQKAQVAFIAAGKRPGSSIDWSSPAYWAAFTLTGDWK
jgi:CHAT domain-containing protein